MILGNHTCPASDTAAVEQENFFDGRWDAHEIGWVIAGVTAAISVILSGFLFFMHARNYRKPKEQRQIMRIALMPGVYAIISFFSYRFFRAYTYYSLLEIVYESLVLAAFLMLLLVYIGESTAEQKRVLMDKDKRKIPFPFCCIRFRPSKPYFTHALKWSVLQYSLLRPLVSLAGVITEALDLYCATSYSIYFSAVYLDAIDFVSISIALYGLIVFYALVKERLAGKQPLLKFLSIKGIVMITFYQGFVFSILASHGVIKATEYWTTTNIADGLQALCTCCEMVIFGVAFLYAFPWKPYKDLRPQGAKSTSVFWAALDSFNYADFIVEGWRGLVFTYRYILNKPGTHSEKRLKDSPGLNLDAALGESDSPGGSPKSSHPMAEGGEGTGLRRTMTWGSSQAREPETKIPVSAFGRRSVDSGRGGGERRSWEAGLFDNPYASGSAAAAGGGEGGIGSSRTPLSPQESEVYQMEAEPQGDDERGGRDARHPHARGTEYGQAQ